MQYPEYRSRRLRKSENLRSLVRETQLSSRHLIQPLVIGSGKAKRRPIEGWPGHVQFSVEEAVEEAKKAEDLGIPALYLIGLIDEKQRDRVGSEAWDDQGLIQQATRAIKKACPELVLIADASFENYTSHGHGGVTFTKGGVTTVDNEASLENLARFALSLARAGIDLVAPTSLLDGSVGIVREALDEQDFEHISILSDSVHYASCFANNFRLTDKKVPNSDWIDPANMQEAIREVSLDVSEGADVVMITPALPYLDIIAHIKHEFDVPLAAFETAAEYSLLALAAEQKFIDYGQTIIENLTSIRRAGADMILTYHAQEAAKLLQGLEEGAATQTLQGMEKNS